MSVAIIDYGAGNIQSIRFALTRLGVSATLSCDSETIQSASHVIKTGAIDMISHRKDQRDVITNLVSILLKKRQSQEFSIENTEKKVEAVNQ